MKRILLALIFLCGARSVFGQDFKLPTEKDYPRLTATAARAGDFLPAGWTIVGQAEGDLNGDKKKDVAMVIKASEKQFLNKNENLGTDIFDTNPRVLAILFAENGGYKLALQSNTFIVPPDSPTMEEPFQEIRIENGVLLLNFEIFYSAGSWGMSNHTYRFRFQNGAFRLIGADQTETQRNTGEIETRSYNFLTKKVKSSKGNVSNDKDKVQWRNFRLKELKTFETFPEPFKWEIEKGYFL